MKLRTVKQRIEKVLNRLRYQRTVRRQVERRANGRARMDTRVSWTVPASPSRLRRQQKEQERRVEQGRVDYQKAVEALTALGYGPSRKTVPDDEHGPYCEAFATRPHDRKRLYCCKDKNHPGEDHDFERAID